MPAREILFYEFDEFRLDVKKEELLRDSDPVPLTHKAFQVLLILVQNFGQTVEKETIYQELWGDSFVEDANLTQHIYILRKTLGPDPSGESYIETVARSGYRFTADINTIYASVIPPRAEPARSFTPSDDESEEPPEELTVPERPRLTLLRKVSETPEEEALPSVPEPDFHKVEPKKRPFRGRWIILGLALIAFSILTGLAVRQFILRKTAPPLSVSLAKSIAVLPLKPIGAESANEKLGLGMADAIITRLGRLRVIPVRPTSSVFRYTDQPPESSLSAGHELGVDTVLEGTVQRDDERVRVSVRLINVSDASTVWAENFDENFTNIFNVQDSISAKVVRALQVSLTPQEENSLAQHSSSSTEAYQAYQLGVYYGSSRTKDGLEKAVTYFQKAVEADPKYARAYAMLSDAYNMLGYYSFADPYEMMKKSSDAANKALELDERLPETYVALAYLKRFEKDGGPKAKQLLEKAIEIGPFNSTARVRYAWILVAEGDLDGSVQQMRLAQEYDPLSVVSNGALCSVLIWQGKSDEGIKYCERSVEMSPDMQNSKVALAEAYFAAGRHAEAIALAEKVVAATEGNERLEALGSLGYFHAKTGHKKDAEKAMAEITPHLSQSPYLLDNLIVINYALGKKEEGFAAFEQLAGRRGVARFRVIFDPAWADVRADERVMKRLNES